MPNIQGLPRKEKAMAVSKSQQKAVHKYVKANYDRMELTVPKGRKDTIKARADAQGQSVNAYINAAIEGRMAQEDTEGAGGISLPSDTIKAAQEAAEAAGEAVPVFIARAVETQAQRDEMGRRMKGGKANE